MTEITSYKPGTPSWVDIGTSDLEGAIAFYSGLFGWEIEMGDPEMGRYSMALLNGAPVAALADQQAPGPVFWASYITTADVDATLVKVEAAGGSVVVPAMDVMDFGRMAVVTDPGGAHISFWQPGTHIGAGRVNEPGSLVWNELMTRSVDETIAFYNKVVGWTDNAVDMGEMVYHEMQLDGNGIGGLMAMDGPDFEGVPSHWLVYFAVEDADATAAKCAELGGGVAVPPMDIPPGRFAMLTDPQGAVFSVLKLAEPM